MKGKNIGAVAERIYKPIAFTENKIKSCELSELQNPPSLKGMLPLKTNKKHQILSYNRYIP